MGISATYIRHVDVITKEEFTRLFSTGEHPENWFSVRESEIFSSPGHVKNLAARYLVKKRICDQIRDHGYRKEIEILNDPFGKPEITFGKNIAKAIEQAGIKEIMCSISHSRNYITGLTIFCL